MFTRRRQRRQAKQAHRAEVAAEVLNARGFAIAALHEEESPETVASILTALEHFDAALAILSPRLPDHPHITDAIAATPPRI